MSAAAAAAEADWSRGQSQLNVDWLVVTGHVDSMLNADWLVG